jgi:hypothetical protein
MSIKPTFMDAQQLVSFGESHVLKETIHELQRIDNRDW